MKRYTRHGCRATHRTYNRFARCAIKSATWVTGEGPYAVIAWCRVPTVTLWITQGEAERAKTFIDATGCGGRCSRQHEVVKLDREP